MNMTVYGDSILKWVRFENGKYVADHAPESRLAERFGLRLTNRSRFGCTIAKAMPRIRMDSAARCAEPEYALLEFGGNDCDFDWAAVASAPDAPHECKTPPPLFESLYREAIALLRAGGRTVVLATLPPINSELYLRFLCRGGLSRERIVHWLGDVERIYRWQESYSETVARISREEHTGLVDLRGPFLRDARPASALLCPDGIHPSRLGQGLMYEALCAAMP